MFDLKDKLRQLLDSGFENISNYSDAEMSHNISPEKWSKKEILGHLVDSGINNLQRFTEIQFESKPYKIRTYNQNKLVKSNDYQNIDSKAILALWKSINDQILHLIKIQTPETLSYEIILVDGNISDLRFLMEDYVNHLEHHLNQIID